MADLITETDLDEYGIEVGSHEAAVTKRLIRSASAAVRQAAASPILETTSTVTLFPNGGQLLRLPGLPIRAVEAVERDGDPVTGWKRRNSGIYRPAGWGMDEVTVTYIHGFRDVPDDIKELVVSMVIAGLHASRDEEGLALNNGQIQSIRIDDYSETYSTSGDSVEAVTPMALPSRTRRWLSARFGGGAEVVTTL